MLSNKLMGISEWSNLFANLPEAKIRSVSSPKIIAGRTYSCKLLYRDTFNTGQSLDKRGHLNAWLMLKQYVIFTLLFIFSL